MLMCLPPLGGAGREFAAAGSSQASRGEQYAAPEAGWFFLRDVRRKPHTQQYVSLSAADPLKFDRHHYTGGKAGPRLPAIGCCTRDGFADRRRMPAEEVQ